VSEKNSICILRFGNSIIILKSIVIKKIRFFNTRLKVLTEFQLNKMVKLQNRVFSFFHRNVIPVVFFITLYSISAAAEDLILRAFVLPGAPIINKKEKKVLYGLDLIFNAEPKDFWVYYNNNKKKLVLDFYGVHIKGKPKLDFPGRAVFKDYKIINSDTKMSLSNKQSSILIGMDPDPQWLFKATVIDKRIVRITAWKDIAQLTKGTRKKMRNPFILYLVLSILAVSLAFTAVLVYKNTSNET